MKNFSYGGSILSLGVNVFMILYVSFNLIREHILVFN